MSVKFKVPNLTTGHKLDNKDALAFMLGGNSWFTFKSLKTNKDFSFGIIDAKVWSASERKKVATPERKNVFLFIGANQVVVGKSYAWMGSILQDKQTGEWRYSPGRTRDLPDECEGEKAFMFVFNSFLAGTRLPLLEIWHQGVCACCGKRLTVSKSIELAIGPVCGKKLTALREKLNQDIEFRRQVAQQTLNKSTNRVNKDGIIDRVLGATPKRPTSGVPQGNLFNDLPDHSKGVKR